MMVRVRLLKGCAPAFLLIGGLGLLLASCSPTAPALMAKESLFKMELGTLDDQIDLFLRSGLPSQQKNSFSFSDGLVLVANGNARKVMEFSSYGDLLTLFYNPDANPVPSLMGTVEKGKGLNPVKNRRAFSYAFNEVGAVALNAANQLFVEDKVPSERRSYDRDNKIVLESRILRFSKDGIFLDFLGQEGIGGTPFPALERLVITSKGDIVVICRTGKGWRVWWYNDQGSPVLTVSVDLGQLPLPTGSSTAGWLPQLETLYPDWVKREIHAKIDYFSETLDATTKTPSGIQVLHSLVWTYDLAKQQWTSHFEVPLLKREKARGATYEPLGDRPYAFLGVSESGASFFLSSVENHSQRFLVLGRGGETLLERSIELAGADTLFAQYQISPHGILAGFLSDGTSAEMAWWRSDKLLGSYVQTGF